MTTLQLFVAILAASLVAQLVARPLTELTDYLYGHIHRKFCANCREIRAWQKEDHEWQREDREEYRKSRKNKEASERVGFSSKAKQHKERIN